MRVSPAIRVKGVSLREVSGSANPNDRLAKNRESGPAACLHVRYVDFIRDLKALSTSRTWSGLSSNDGRASNPKPARSDGLDNVDGGPDAAFYIQMRVVEQVSI